MMGRATCCGNTAGVELSSRSAPPRKVPVEWGAGSEPGGKACGGGQPPRHGGEALASETGGAAPDTPRRMQRALKWGGGSSRGLCRPMWTRWWCGCRQAGRREGSSFGAGAVQPASDGRSWDRTAEGMEDGQEGVWTWSQACSVPPGTPVTNVLLLFSWDRLAGRGQEPAPLMAKTVWSRPHTLPAKVVVVGSQRRGWGFGGWGPACWCGVEGRWLPSCSLRRYFVRLFDF